ncbi:ubiquitin-like protein Pup [Arcanobacterium wilhelmae]|uniref:Prokaryotic ubiquitin-like protein Pup n=1 Tax=Arcanobacterium wilhelmae TaxID=1803177 RepID=A0ABT9N8E7_9ACTO|nr:ubiquitin-like protein Pup [Arcanobacterium wilhelmae]MDP9799973.1 ubiquitin-like protein Pup [Arcanobacterium wilhelmae]WFN91106.1 ubiquitin-like protein Pup [Arcanobacterium wilhelmae]
MSQEFIRPNAAQEENVVTPLEQPQVTDVDSLLDDIDAILEDNAASFVAGFVQKGGQ